MGIAYKNFWSINTDEAVVAGQLRYFMPKEIEIYMPLNAQMKGIDLLAYNNKTRKSLTLQIKGSRAYEPTKKEKNNYGDGSATWFMFKKDVIDKAQADYFIFIHYILEENKKSGRRLISPHFVTIPTRILQENMKRNGYAVRGDRYALYTWINPLRKTAEGIYKNNINFTKYLDGAGFKSFLKDFLD